MRECRNKSTKVKCKFSISCWLLSALRTGLIWKYAESTSQVLNQQSLAPQLVPPYCSLQSWASLNWYGHKQHSKHHSHQTVLGTHKKHKNTKIKQSNGERASIARQSHNNLCALDAHRRAEGISCFEVLWLEELMEWRRPAWKTRGLSEPQCHPLGKSGCQWVFLCRSCERRRLSHRWWCVWGRCDASGVSKWQRRRLGQ